MKISKNFFYTTGIFTIITLLLIAMCYYSQARYVGDTALYAQITNNIAHSGKAEGNIYANTQDFIDRGIGGISVEERLASVEAFTPPEVQERNILTFHSCFILYLIAPLCYFMSPFTCVTIVQSIALALSIVFLILFLREKKIPIPIIVATCVLLTAHPGWSQPAVYGAFYPERLFMGTGMYLIYSCEKEKFSRIHFILAALLCAMVGERGALYAGMFILAYTIFYWKHNSQYRILRLAVGGFLLLYTGIIMKFVLNNLYYSDIGGKINFLSYFSNPQNREKLFLFLLINIVFLLVALFDWRAFVIGAASMIPNLLYDVGGAEKIGWSLHYHVFYFVFIMWAVTKGVIKLYEWIGKRSKLKQLQFSIPIVIALLFSFIISVFNPYDVKISVGTRNLKNNVIYSGAKQIYGDYFHGGRQLRIKFNKFIEENVPSGITVTTIEAGMPALENQKVNLYPMGIDTADMALVGYAENNGEYEFNGSVVYGYAGDIAFFDKQVVERMRKYGYDLDNPILFHEYGVALIKRMQ